jgi:hypothetical protein
MFGTDLSIISYTTRADVNDGGAGAIRVKPNSEIPGNLSLVPGEMLYQLRAALDGAIYEAAALASGQNPSQEKFPEIQRGRI